MVTAQLFQYVDGEKKLLVQIGHNIHEVRQLVELTDSVVVEAGPEVKEPQDYPEDLITSAQNALAWMACLVVRDPVSEVKRRKVLQKDFDALTLALEQHRILAEAGI